MRMRTLLAIAGLTMVPALAVAEGDGSVSPGQMGSDVSPGQEERTAMPGQMGQMGQTDQQSQQQIFQSRDHFNIEGTVASVNPNQKTITVNRPNLPPAELSTANQTKVKVDGRQATLSDLQPGTEIRAKFNLAQDQAIATEVDAKSNRGSRSQQQQPGSTPSP